MKLRHYILTALAAALLLHNAAASLQIQNNLGHDLQPGQKNLAGNFTVTASNETVEVTDIVTNGLPFTASYSPSSSTIDNRTQNIETRISVPSDFPAGNVSGEAIFVLANRSNIQKPVNFQVTKNRNWTISDYNFKNNVSVGNGGKLGEIQFRNNGNTRVDLQVNSSGNLTQFLGLESTTLYRGTSDTYFVNYDIPRSTEFGYYNSSVTFYTDTENESRTVNLSARFLDKIKPELEAKQFEDFSATKPSTFKIDASDNIKVNRVSTEVLYETQVQRNNSTVTVNQSLENISFDRKEDTTIWTGKMQNNDRVGEYYINGSITDRAGNTVYFTDRYSVSQLDVITTKSNIELPAYKYDSEFTYPVGNIERDTDLTVTLDSFNQPLEDDSSGESWSIGLNTPSGKEYFSNVKSSITLEQAGEISLFVYGDTPERFQGELSYNPIDEHTNLNKTTFYGRFTDYTSPKDREFVLYNKVYRCDGHSSKLLNNSYWNCEFNISASTVPPESELGEAVQFVIPQQVKEKQEQQWQTRIDEAKQGESKAQNTSAWALRLLFIGILSGIYGFRYYPRHYGCYIKATSRTQQARKSFKEILQEKFGDKIPSIK